MDNLPAFTGSPCVNINADTNNRQFTTFVLREVGERCVTGEKYIYRETVV